MNEPIEQQYTEFESKLLDLFLDTVQGVLAIIGNPKTDNKEKLEKIVSFLDGILIQPSEILAKK